MTRPVAPGVVPPPGSPIRAFVPPGFGSETEYFDHVAVCCGSNAAYRMPKYDGQDTFRGKIIHSR